MKQLIAVVGPKRSGLHAIVNWLIGQHQGRVRFVNDPPIELPPDSQNLRGCYEYDVTPDSIRLRPTLHLLQRQAQDLNWSLARKLAWPLSGIVRRILKRHWEPRILREHYIPPELDGNENTPPDTHIILFEDISPEAAARSLPDWLAAYRALEGIPQVEKQPLFIILRSPWNCLASTLRYWQSRTHENPPFISNPLRRKLPSASVESEHVMNLWTTHAKEIIGETQYFGSSHWKIQPLIYDHWLESPKHRAAIASDLGLQPTDMGMSRSSTHGGGSSFKGQQNTPSSKQNLTDRWQQYHDHPLMKTLLSSEEIRRLTQALKIDMPDIHKSQIPRVS